MMTIYPMGFEAYQEAASETAIYPQDRALEYLMCKLGSEAGEVLGKHGKMVRGDYMPNYAEAIIDELGDVLWYVSEIARQLNYPLEVVARRNIAKLQQRKAQDLIKGDGDYRGQPSSDFLDVLGPK